MTICDRCGKDADEFEVGVYVGSEDNVKESPESYRVTVREEKGLEKVMILVDLCKNCERTLFENVKSTMCEFWKGAKICNAR